MGQHKELDEPDGRGLPYTFTYHDSEADAQRYRDAFAFAITEGYTDPHRYAIGYIDGYAHGFAVAKRHWPCTDTPDHDNGSTDPLA